MKDLTPNPDRYPVCSLCEEPYVLRRSFLFDTKKGRCATRFIWQRDCKHKKAAAKINKAVVALRPVTVKKTKAKRKAR